MGASISSEGFRQGYPSTNHSGGALATTRIGPKSARKRPDITGFRSTRTGGFGRDLGTAIQSSLTRGSYTSTRASLTGKFGFGRNANTPQRVVQAAVYPQEHPWCCVYHCPGARTTPAEMPLPRDGIQTGRRRPARYERRSQTKPRLRALYRPSSRVYVGCTARSLAARVRTSGSTLGLSRPSIGVRAPLRAE